MHGRRRRTGEEEEEGGGGLAHRGGEKFRIVGFPPGRAAEPVGCTPEPGLRYGDGMRQGGRGVRGGGEGGGGEIWKSFVHIMEILDRILAILCT